MKFSLPSSRKEMKDVCIQFDGGNCSSAGALSYIALPHCSLIVPATTWIRYCWDPQRASLLQEEGRVRVHKSVSITQIHPAVVAAPKSPLRGPSRKSAHHLTGWLSCCHLSALSTACFYFTLATEKLTAQTFSLTTVPVLSPGGYCALLYQVPLLFVTQGSYPHSFSFSNVWIQRFWMLWEKHWSLQAASTFQRSSLRDRNSKTNSFR